MKSIPSNTLLLTDSHVTVRQSRHTIVQYISFVVIRRQRQFTVLDRFQFVRARTKQSVFRMFDPSLAQRRKYMSCKTFFFTYFFLLPLAVLFTNFGSYKNRLYILERRPTNSSGGLLKHSSFIFPMTFLLTAE
jgi:hypothetical protein